MKKQNEAESYETRRRREVLADVERLKKALEDNSTARESALNRFQKEKDELTAAWNAALTEYASLS
jgi:hypothetical protein